MKPEQLQKFYNMAEPRSEEAIRKAQERKTKREDKELLLQDLCARLPYGVKAQVYGWDEEKGEVEIPLKIYSMNTDGYVYFESNDYNVDYSSIEECKPYLRPMSSMTEEEREELKELTAADIVTNSGFGYENLRGMCFGMMYIDCQEIIDWLNKNMFDFRGLIPKGHALSTDEFNPYIED